MELTLYGIHQRNLKELKMKWRIKVLRLNKLRLVELGGYITVSNGPPSKLHLHHQTETIKGF